MVSKAKARFDQEFGTHLKEMAERCFFLEDESTGNVVGTTTAWHGEMCGVDQGRIHFVAIAQSHQGRGLSKVLLRHALDYVAKHHTQCYLTTQNTSARAIRLYLQLGFAPLTSVSPVPRSAWAFG